MRGALLSRANLCGYNTTTAHAVERILQGYSIMITISPGRRFQYLQIIPKIKKFGCVGRGDLTLLFKSCEIDKSQGRLV